MAHPTHHFSIGSSLNIVDQAQAISAGSSAIRLVCRSRREQRNRDCQTKKTRQCRQADQRPDEPNKQTQPENC